MVAFIFNLQKPKKKIQRLILTFYFNFLSLVLSFSTLPTMPPTSWHPAPPCPSSPLFPILFFTYFSLSLPISFPLFLLFRLSLFPHPFSLLSFSTSTLYRLLLSLSKHLWLDKRENSTKQNHEAGNWKMSLKQASESELVTQMCCK